MKDSGIDTNVLVGIFVVVILIGSAIIAKWGDIKKARLEAFNNRLKKRNALEKK